uniref:Uncharacterized protein n=1 Tax=Fibrocapsa japonica TaxID=94617 RepID=A0A7S2V1B0_9STRA|mmetsp:Transcript_23875/g.34729  ORF Transcript_23875/g.34729 Transcript_23875/m.34729 type:complete len:176 (+) Transcript_23875:89-616(+)|eukprot:CAMPEP_0113935566 /NCGR_PEP_ID=MMETSP1339-20121228/2705_1 /TAXON_ID=94617 /ORGANISM="Fibrocapsa japonica" /LENGTH=175 /DNA_ID=CAMNT_0000937775 /DNA_START=79 /DNA_END=606 /DNA_ORIENTATION=+ /assembly_acc=CAM_ASM_000762
MAAQRNIILTIFAALLFVSANGFHVASTSSLTHKFARSSLTTRWSETSASEKPAASEASTPVPPEDDDSDDYIPVDQIPGKIEFSQEELARQDEVLNRMAAEYRKESVAVAQEEARFFGWTEKAEIINGRMAMIGITSGVWVQLVTGKTIPQQVMDLLQVLGFVSLGNQSGELGF